MGMERMSRKRRLLRWSAAAMMVAAPAVSQAQTAEDNTDPWESINRPIFTFNDTLDTYALKPVARGYRYVTPQFVQTGVSNFFGNIGDLLNVTNNLLQGKVHDAGIDTARLLLNTTVGVLGVFDFAGYAGLPKHDEDFGQTLGKWGVGSGPYVVLPLLGPSTVRDTFSRIPDYYNSPYPYMDSDEWSLGLVALNVVDRRADLLDSEKMIVGDKYIFIRNAYLQNREFKVKDGQVEDDF